MSADIARLRRFLSETRFVVTGGATRRPVQLIDEFDSACNELEALREFVVAYDAARCEQETDGPAHVRRAEARVNLTKKGFM